MTFSSSRRGRGRLLPSLAVIAIVTLFAPFIAFQSATAAEGDPDEPVLVQFEKTAIPPAALAAVGPAGTLTYQFTINCSSLETDCLNLALTDVIPAPLVLQSVSTAQSIPPVQTVITGNGFTVRVVDDLGGGLVGLQAGTGIQINATATVPSNLSADYDGAILPNTATVTVSNREDLTLDPPRPATIPSSAAVRLAVDRTLASQITKTITPDSATAVEGAPVTISLGATNASNGSVDSLVIQEPANLSSTVLDTLQVTGLSGVAFPAGADRIRVDWYNGSTWTTGTASATAALPSGVPTADIQGLRFTFTSSTGGRIAIGGTAAITVNAALSASAALVTEPTTVVNTASSWVTYAADSTPPVQASDSIVIGPPSISPVATKQFGATSVIGGDQVLVTLGGSIGGDFGLKAMTITEPSPGSTSLAAQGLSFDGWVDADIEWPIGATSAQVSYKYVGDLDYTAPISTTTADTLPDPVDPALVTDIRVTFLSTLPQGIAPGQYTVLPFLAMSDPVVSDITTVNEVRVDVVTLTDETAFAVATDDLTRRTLRVNTEVNKVATPSQLYSFPGATTLLSIPARITPLPTSAIDPTASTVGATSLTVTDPLDATTDEFWNWFNLSAIVATAVPGNTLMTVEYYDGTDWLALPGATDVAGPTYYSTTINPALRDTIEGVRFIFRHATYDTLGTLLNPGFSVQPNLYVSLRDQLRDGTGEAASSTRVVPIVIDNVAQSRVVNPLADPNQATDDDPASVELLPIADVEGIEKRWLPVASTGIEAVNARSSDRATARISWGTGGVPFDSIMVSDTADDPSTTPVADTVFDAFDLVRINPITSTLDPLLVYDQVTEVELYVPGSGWVATTTNPCAAGACDGTFPGYTLTAAESAAATGVRLVFEESPTRSTLALTDPDAPPVGSGVAPSVALDRQFDLTFEVRDQRRSDPSVAVLGTTRQAIYNVIGEFGTVRNTARVDGRDGTDAVVFTQTASDDILILDSPLTVSVSKTWVDGPLGTPPVGTPQSLYPRARMTIDATNESVIAVNELAIADPVAGTNPFDAVNVFDIVTITVPSGATATEVRLERESGAIDLFTRTAALALTTAQLADVVGIEVVHTGRIDVQASTRIVLDTQLRAELRSAPGTIVNSVSSAVVENTAEARVVDPGGVTVPALGETDNTVTAQDSASVAVVDYTYGVTATKGIVADTTATPGTPATQIEGNSRVAAITLTGQPSGTVRSTDMVVEDISPTFWNAYNFTALGSHSFSTPINRVKLDVLLGVNYVIDGLTGDISVECGGSATLDACWVNGAFANSLTLPTLPPGATTADIRGIRAQYTRADGATWERPFNPTQTLRFTATRRDVLVAPVGEPVPSTLYVFTQPAPGEATVGVFTNDLTVTSWADNGVDAPRWQATDDDTKQILFQHRPAKVQIVKTPFGPLTLGAPIPFEIEVTNRGTELDKQLTGLEIVDLIPVDNPEGPQLVLPIDPDTDLPFDPNDVITLTVIDEANNPVTAPSFTAVLGTVELTGQELTITIDPSFVLEHGWSMTINAPMLFRQFFEAGSETDNFVLNSATVTSDQPFDECTPGRDGNGQPTIFEVASCTATTRVWALPSAPMTIIKGVKGVEAGPLDTNGTPLIDPLTGNPYDDLGVIKTVAANPADCSAPTLAVAGNEYYRYPCVPITRPGGTEEWVGYFFNAGNVRVYKISSIDVLPRENDRGVIINDPRSSKWAPVLLERPRLIGYPEEALTVYYTSRLDLATPTCNGADIQNDLGMSPSSDPPMVQAYWPCVSSAAAGGLTDRANPATGWQVMPAVPSTALLESVVALKFVIDFEDGGVTPVGLAPGESVTVAYETRTALEPVLRETTPNLARDSIAYNSLAGAARGFDGINDLPYRFVTEPRKVGVALATGAVDLAKVITGAGASFAPSTVRIDLACTVDIDGAGTLHDPEPIELLTSAGVDRTPFTLTGNAAATRILGIPLYAVCDVSEVGTTGATSTVISPEQVISRALDSSPSTVVNPVPAFDSRPAIPQSTVTNTYDLAGLTVTKTVNMNGAVNANGDPVMQTGFNFSIACTFDNGSGPTALTVTPGTFTLNNGGTRTYTGLPAGAVCTVTETQTRSATVSKVITTGGSAAASTPGATAVVTLAPNSIAGDPTNSVAYTNSISVGSLTVTKAITGAGATAPYDFGDGEFTVLVNCTRASASISPATQPPGAGSTAVWYGTLTFSKSTQLSQTINNIPAGSSCAITEQGSAGATQVTNPSNVTILANSTVSRTVTNRFDLASLTVGKTVLTDAVDAGGDPVYPTDPFEFSVACTFQGDTVIADTFASSPMTFELRHAETRTLTGLPAGASCSVTETEDQDADSTSIVRTVNATSASISGTTTTIASLAANGGTVLAPVTTNSTQFTNRYGVTSFTISKDVIGGGATQFAPANFTANVVCTAPIVGESYNGDVTVPANGFVTIDNLADGSTCTVFERDVAATGADAHRIVDDAGTVISGEDILITAAQPGRVTLENYYLTGELEVTKTVLGAGATYGDGPFEVTLVCERGGTNVTIAGGATRELLPGGTVSYTLLPSGAECTLTESDRAGATSSRILDASGNELTDSVATGHTFTVTVNNTVLTDNQPQPALEVENTFELATLDVTKTVSSAAVDADGTPIGFGPFPVAIDCTFEGDAVYGTSYSAATPMRRDLEDGETWSLTGLPDGASCTITETNTMDAAATRVVTIVDAGAVITTPGDSATVTLGTTTTAEIENDYTVGSIQLVKVVDGEGVDPWASAPFTIDVTCELDDATGTRTVFDDTFTFVLGDDPVTIENLATGAVCTITETATGGASSTTVTVDGTSVDGVTADATIADALVEVEVTNTFDLGEVQVEKVRNGDGAATWGDGPFEVELTCVRTIDGVDEQIDIPGGATRSLSSASLYRATYSDLPLDAACSLVETTTAGATTSSIDVDVVTVAADPVGFVVMNTFDVGSVEIEKTFEGDGTGLFVEGTFEASLACTLVIDGVVTDLAIPGGAARELTSLNGYRNNWQDIPAGADCTVTETRTGGAASVALTDGEFIMGAGEVHQVSLENTFLLATFSITKSLAGPFAFEASDLEFTIETSCMWDRDGELVPLLPGGWPVTPPDPSAPPVANPETSVTSKISNGVTVTFEDLPASAECSVTEVDSGGATAQLLWVGGVLQLGDLSLQGGLNETNLSNVFMTTLALTGVEIMLWLWVIGALLFSGMVLVTISRRRVTA